MDQSLDQHGTPQPGGPMDAAQDVAHGAAHDLAERAGTVVDEVRDRLPDLVDAGGRALDQVVQSSPAAIDASIDLIDRSSSTTLAVIAGVCAGLSAGILLSRAPRFLGLLVGAMALVLGGALLGRRAGHELPWD